MARLPQPGGDDGNWGDILNDYLRQAHTETGSLKPSAVGRNAIQDASITEEKLAPSLAAKINAAPSGGNSGGGGNNGGNTGTQWSAAAQAAAQGYWIEYGSTPPTETMKYGVPVIWARDSGMSQPIPVSASPPSFP